MGQLLEKRLIGLAPLDEAFMKLQEELEAVVLEGFCFRTLEARERFVLKPLRRKVINHEFNLCVPLINTCFGRAYLHLSCSHV